MPTRSSWSRRTSSSCRPSPSGFSMSSSSWRTRGGASTISNVTSHPSSEWAAQQMIEALPWDNVPRYLLRDRDAIYGESFRARVRGMGVREVLTAPQSPWQNLYAERLIGSIRRECLDHVIVFNESSLRRLLNLYFSYYLRSRTHLALGKDPPVSRPVQPPALGAVVELPEVGGLHHRYERRAA